MQLNPKLNKGEYVFVSVSDYTIARDVEAICIFREKEGTTLILEKIQAEKLNLQYEYIAAWITLEINSSLDAVGLTATFSIALANQGISCNVVAGFYHDHLFVAYHQANKALDILNNLL